MKTSALLTLTTCISSALAFESIYNCHFDHNGPMMLEHGEMKYLAGGAFTANSTFARCINGTVECFIDDGNADAEMDVNNPVSCSFEDTKARRLGVAGLSPEMWPANTLCYQLTGAFTAAEETLIQTGIEQYDTATNIKIMTTAECEAQTDRANLCGNCQNFAAIAREEDRGCSSQLGYQSIPAQSMNLAPACFNNGFGTVIHEFGHALGLFHEHMHPNRNVIVLRDGLRVPPGNYEVVDQIVRASDYDPNSIMHYSIGSALCVPKPEYQTLRFCDIDETAADGCTIPTDVYCDPTVTRANSGIGQRQNFSYGDISTLNQMYTGPRGIMTAPPTTTAPARRLRSSQP